MAETGQQNLDPTAKRSLWRTAVQALSALGFVTLMAGGTALLHMRANAEQPPAANPPVRVAVKTVKFSDSYSVTERFAGRLEPARQTRLAFEQPGRVTDILFEEGDKVPQGAVTAHLDTRKLQAERSRLLAQRKELVARQSLAEATLRRQKVLAKKGWRSEQKFDEAYFRSQEIAASIARLDASVASIDVDISKSVLTAPYAGTVAARFIDEGAIVSSGTPVIELLGAANRQVRVGVSTEAAQFIHKGEIYRLSAGGKDFQGRLISKRRDLQTGTRTVTVLLDVFGDDTLPFGEVVELLLDRRIAARGLWLPVQSLGEGRKGLWTVMTVTKRNGAPAIATEAVEILHVEADRVFARGTIADGAQVVINGTNRVIAGQQVALAAKE